MGKIAFVFAGQGSQYPGMGKDVCAAYSAAIEVFELAERLRPGTRQQCFAGTKETLMITENTQPCLFTVDLAVAAALEEKGVRAQGVAGFSLGEIPALTFAGAFNREEGFALVTERAREMNRAAEAHDGCMAAVLKLDPQTVEALCAAHTNVWPVNYNSPRQIVAAGDRESMAAFVQRVKEAKGLAMPLNVSGAFHSPHMSGASAAIEEVLTELSYRKPRIDVYANANAMPYPAGEAEGKALIAAQVKSPVLWQKTVERMVADGFDIFVEVGPGKTLSGLIKKITPEVRVYNAETAADVEAVATALL